jgi:small subunit ribosomal protein S16
LAVKLRLKRFGRLNHPTYRVCAAEARFPRDGRVIETIGFYLPKARGKEQLFDLNADRIRYWLSVGAQPSETVESLIRKAGIELPQRTPRKGAAKRRARKTTSWQPPQRLGKGRLAKKKWKQKHAPQTAAPAAAEASADE